MKTLVCNDTKISIALAEVIEFKNGVLVKPYKAPNVKEDEYEVFECEAPPLYQGGNLSYFNGEWLIVNPELYDELVLQKAEDLETKRISDMGVCAKSIGSDKIIDFSKDNNFSITLTGTTSLIFENLRLCKSGTIAIKQDATGGRALTLPSICKTPNGASISFVTTANSLSLITYFIVSENEVLVNYIGNFK